MLRTFALEPAALQGVLLVRHARAGQREAYDGDDDERPLDAKGRRQAAALVGELACSRPTAVHSAPLERCRGTVAPLAEKLGTPVEPEKLLAEEPTGTIRPAARRRLVDLATAQRPGGTIVVCSQGGVIPGVVKSLAGRSDVPIGRGQHAEGRLLVPVLRRAAAGAGRPVPGAAV